MDLEELRRMTQMSLNQGDDGGPWRESLPGGGREGLCHDRAEFDLSLLAPCEFCNRTFVPTSLAKHRRGCYNTWIKQKDRDSKIDRERHKYQTPIGYNGEKPILTIEQMLAKRRQRRLNWRLRHEEFMRAVHAARDYADAVASGNPLPPPPPPIVEPDLKQCPHCQRRFHEKAIERHLTRCKEQSIRNNKERPSYQSMEAKRRLAVRLYYQPSSRPNSCLSMTNPPSSMSYSRPTSRQTDYDYSRNTDSPNDSSIGRYSSMSTNDNNDSKFKIPDSIYNNQVKTHGRQTPRTMIKENNSRNSTPVFDSRNSTPVMTENYMSGRNSNLSTFSCKNPKRHNLVNTPTEPQSFLNKYTTSLKQNEIYGPGGHLKRSTSCISQSRCPSVIIAEKRTAAKLLLKNNNSNGDNPSLSRKPFSCGKSSSKESINKKETLKTVIQMNKSNESINQLFKRSPNNKGDRSVISQRSSSISERKKSIINKNYIPTIDFDKQNFQSKTLKTDQSKSRRVKNELSMVESKSKIIMENNVINNEKVEIRKNKHRTKLIKSNIDISTTLKVPKISKIFAENVEGRNKENVCESSNTNRVRNEVQIHIQPFVRPEVSKKAEVIEPNEKLVNVPSINVAKQKSTITHLKGNENSFTVYRQIDSKEESPNSSKGSSKRFVSNYNISKAQIENPIVQSQSSASIKREKHLNSNNVTTNLYQCKSIRSVSISDQNSAPKYRSTISLQDSLSRCEDNKVTRSVKSNELAYFCQDCGHKFPSHEAKFCCSCGCRRSEIPVKNGKE